MRALLSIPVSMALALAAHAAPAEMETSAAANAGFAQYKTAHDRYMRQVAKTLGASAHPRHWSIAALALATAGGVTLDENARERGELLDRALVAAPGDRVVLWQVALNCPQSATCRADEALARLQELEPKNAAVWALYASREQSRDATPGSVRTHAATVRAALASAARASRFDMHLGDVLAESLAALQPVPVDPEFAALFFTPEDGFPHTDFAVRAAAAVSFAIASMIPFNAPFATNCRSKAAADDAALRADCLAYFGLLAGTDGDLVSPRVGLETIRVLVPGTEAEAANAAALRSLDWLTEASRRPEVNRFTDDAELASYLDDWKRGGELHAIRQRMVRAGIPLEPPPEFRSRSIAH